MATAIIIAAGSGKRMGLKTPKQFIKIEGKPVLMYTLEEYEKHPGIDSILVVCLPGYLDYVRDYSKRLGITKLLSVIDGGLTGQESIYAGVKYLEGKVSPESVVIIHDGVRPLVDSHVLSDVIDKTKKYGNAVSSMPYNEQIFIMDDELSTTDYIKREKIRRVVTPQGYNYKLLLCKYKEAFQKKIGIYGSSYINTMMVSLGVRLFFASGSDKNIKLTTKENLEIFKLYTKLKKEDK